MKKLCLVIPFMLMFCLVGCGTKIDIKNVISEQTEIYFCGEGEGISANISVGKREKNYILDGKHGQNCDFSLISISLEKHNHEEEIKIKIDINGQKSEFEGQLNPLNMTYMADLGYALKANDEISLAVNEQEVKLENISKNFKVDYAKAIDIGYGVIEDKSVYMDEGMLACEGYVKIVDGRKFGGKGLYWCFTLLSHNEASENVLISVDDEKIFFHG